jgi:hypothetical protein
VFIGKDHRNWFLRHFGARHPTWCRVGRWLVGER